MTFIDKWPLFGGYFVLLNEMLSNYGLYLQGGLYSEVVFNTGLTVYKVTVIVSYHQSNTYMCYGAMWHMYRLF